MGKGAGQGCQDAEEGKGNEEDGIERDQSLRQGKVFSYIRASCSSVLSAHHPALTVPAASLNKRRLEERLKSFPRVFSAASQVLSLLADEKNYQ